MAGEKPCAHRAAKNARSDAVFVRTGRSDKCLCMSAHPVAPVDGTGVANKKLEQHPTCPALLVKYFSE